MQARKYDDTITTRFVGKTSIYFLIGVVLSIAIMVS